MKNSFFYKHRKCKHLSMFGFCLFALDNRSVRVRCAHGGMCSVSRVCCSLQLQSSHLLCCYCLYLDVLPGCRGLRLPVELLSSSFVVHAGATEERPTQHHQDGCRPSYKQGGAKLISKREATPSLYRFRRHWEIPRRRVQITLLPK